MAIVRFAVPALLLAAVVRPAAADELRLSARDLFEASTVQNLQLAADGSAIELESGELFEDDGPAAGYTYEPNEESVTGDVRVRKELVIADPRAAKAILLVAPGGDLRARINGREVEWKPEAPAAGGKWQAYSFPTDALRAGKNEFVLSGSGKVWIARDEHFAAGSTAQARHPNRSARSADGGRTWEDARLGPGGDVDGEYYVRVFLDHRRPRGTLLLPVIDAGNLAGRELAAPVKAAGPVRIGVSAKGGGTHVRVRSGPSPAMASTAWSPWQDLGASGGVLGEPAGRYVQVAVDLETADPLHTPALKEVVVSAEPSRGGDDWTKALRVVEVVNGRVVRTAIPFRYEPPGHAALKAMREKFRLDEVVGGAADELGLVTRLAGWSARQWEEGHLGESYPPWDAGEILMPHADGKPVGGFCLQRNVVFLQACESFGLQGRVASIGPGDHGAPIRGGHEVVEIWSNDLAKWVYVDGDMAWYFVDDASGSPLGLRELRGRQLKTVRGAAAGAVRCVRLPESRQEWKGLTGWPPFCELRLVPRSNFLQQKAPLPLNQGMRGWSWTGHHVWTDAECPASLIYGNRVSRAGDWDWTLNQAHVVLEAVEATRELRVHLDTETPGFDTFLAEVDGGGKRPVESGFVWKLHAGRNALRVRPRNVAGREGVVTSYVIVAP